MFNISKNTEIKGIEKTGCANRYGLKNVWTKRSKQFAKRIVGTPYVRGVFISDCRNIVPTQGYESKLALQNLIEHNKQHQHHKTRGDMNNAFVAYFVKLKRNHK